MRSSEPLDYLVIGAGMSGLTFAARTAQAGHRVLVLEQHYLPGGLFTAFKTGGYTFNVGLEWTTDCERGEPFYDLLERLDLADEYRFDTLEVFKTVLSPELEQPLRIVCDRERLGRELARSFPHEEAAIERFLDDALAVTRGEPSAKRILFGAGLKSVETMLGQYFSDPLLVHALYSLISYPDAVGVLLLYIVGAICEGKMYLPRHGDHRHLAVLLHRKLRDWGGEVRYRAPVARVLIEDGTAVGVRLENGEEIRARKIVASSDLHDLYTRLAPEGRELDATIERRLSRRAGFSCFCLFLGLRAPLDGVDEHAHAVLAETASWRAAPEDLATLPLRVEHQAIQYPRLAPPGGATLCAWAVSPISAFDHWGLGRDPVDAPEKDPRYLAAKDAAAEIVLRRLEAFYPDLPAKIAARETATPFTFRRYTRNRAGSVSGFSPADVAYLKEAKFETPVENLYHIGHWTVQSGVNSVMYAAESLFHTLVLPSRGT